MAAVVADNRDEAGYVFLCDAATTKWYQGGRVFTESNGRFQEMRQCIRLDTKLFLYNVNNHVLHGPFRATGLPRLASRTRFPAEVPIALHRDGLRWTVIDEGFVKRGPQSAAEVGALLAQLADGKEAEPDVCELWSGDGQPTSLGAPPCLERPCKWDKEGRCRNGDDCEFAHGGAKVSPPARAFNPPCKFFQEGRCRNGDACHFAHEGREERTADAARSAGATTFAIKRTQCDFFARGYCRNGADCTFAHGEDVALARPRAVPPPPAPDDAADAPARAAAPAPPLAGPPSSASPAQPTERLRKTKLCLFFSGSGQCSKGEDCNYAHGEDELPATYRTKLCEEHRSTGRCPNGDLCNFAHGVEQLRQRADRQPGAPGPPGPPVLLKTKLCHHFEAGRVCPLGQTCKYAHGVAELRCGDFARSGRCDAGDQCRFAHSSEQLRQPPPAAAAGSASGGASRGAAGADKEQPLEENAPARHDLLEEEPAAEPAAGASTDGTKPPGDGLRASGDELKASDDGLKVDDQVFGKYGGDWHRARVIGLLAGGQVEVLWESEVSKSLLAADDVVRIRDGGAGPLVRHDQVVARFDDGKWYRGMVQEVAGAPSDAVEGGTVSVLWQGGESCSPGLPASSVVAVLV